MTTTTKRTTKAAGYILYQGPSLLDQAPIVVLATGTGSRRTKNEKTGNMIQTWIMRADMPPTQALTCGADRSVCGTCPHRGRQENGKGRSCYVTVFQAPLAVWKAWKAGRYQALPHTAEAYAEAFGGRLVRMGAYGDPLAVPSGIWQDVAEAAKGWTGYTHQWNTKRLGFCHLETMRGLVMASCDTQALANMAQAQGWRTFRTMTETETTTQAERLCPAEAAGRSCADCRRCCGTDMDRRDRLPSIAIHIHGTGSKNYVANCRA